jgi:hypothetical protein
MNDEPGIQAPAHQGEHNVVVLAELGYSHAQIAALQASGALVEPTRDARRDETSRAQQPAGTAAGSLHETLAAPARSSQAASPSASHH